MYLYINSADKGNRDDNDDVGIVWHRIPKITPNQPCLDHGSKLLVVQNSRSEEKVEDSKILRMVSSVQSEQSVGES